MLNYMFVLCNVLFFIIHCIQKLDFYFDKWFFFQVHDFLLQTGGILHYNMHVDELSDCVILNPAWLFDVLSKFLKVSHLMSHICGNFASPDTTSFLCHL